MTKIILLSLIAFSTFAHADIWTTGHNVGGLRDYREVMPGLLYRAGGPGGMKPLPSAQKRYLCSQGIDKSFYLYRTGFAGDETVSCNEGQMQYLQENWNGTGYLQIHREIFENVKAGAGPVFIHCWNGIHATGFVAATALIQFCGMAHERAVAYWKVGIAPKIQYPKVIAMIRNFKADPALNLSAIEQARFCPPNL